VLVARNRLEGIGVYLRVALNGGFAVDMAGDDPTVTTGFLSVPGQVCFFRGCSVHGLSPAKADVLAFLLSRRFTR
jgi:hypothetical protein